MTTSLVSGGAGFIGSHVARHLQERGERVVVFDDFSGGTLANLRRGVSVYEGDVANVEDVKNVFELFRPDYVFHLAAYAAEGLSHFIRNYNYTNNLVGSANLINASVLHGVKHFVFTSSIAVYGHGQVPMDESMTPRPEDPYGIAKYAVEMDLHAAFDMFGLEHTIFRPHNVYGPNQNIGDKYRNVIGIFMNQIMHGDPMTIFGDGSQKRAFSYIDDVAPCIADAPFERGAAGETFNIGAEIPYSVLELAHITAQAMEVKNPEIQFLPERNEVQDAYCDHAKLRNVFGQTEPTPLETGLREMAQWAQDTGPRFTPPFTDIEVPRNLPAGWEHNG